MISSVDNFTLGAIIVFPLLGRIQSGQTVKKIEPMVMDALTLLATRQDETILRAEFMAEIWPSEAASDESLTRAISILRKTLRVLDPKTAYIETIPKRGYRLLVAPSQMHRDGVQEARHLNLDGTDMAAKKLILQGQSLNARPFHMDVLNTAADLLQQATVLDPDSAEALSELGHTYSLMSTYLRQGDKTLLIRQAAQCAERALAIDPTRGFALTLIALEQFTLGNIVEAITMAEEAYAREPENPEVVLRLGYFFAVIGLTARAIPLIEKAVSLDPVQGRNYQILATVKLNNGDLDEADKLAKRAIDLQHHFGCETYAAAAFAKGDNALAGQRLLQGRKYLAEFLGDKFVDDVVWVKIIADAYSHDYTTRQKLGQWIKTLLFVPGTPPSIPLAQSIVRTGPPEAFFEIMGEVPPPGTHGTLMCIWAHTEICLKIRNHPDFTPFAKRMGMLPAWGKYGSPDCISPTGEIDLDK